MDQEITSDGIKSDFLITAEKAFNLAEKHIKLLELDSSAPENQLTISDVPSQFRDIFD
jgi:hypothetical protein